MLWLVWGKMLAFGYRFINKSWHTLLQSTYFAVPFEADTNIFLAFPLDMYVIMPLYRVFQVVSVSVANELDTKVINYKCERDWLPHVLPEP